MSLKQNVIANFAGNAWSALVSIAFIPVYIGMMGAESYGLVGIFASLQSLFAILDLGFSATINREMARLSTTESQADRMRDTLRTLEVTYWCMAAVVGIGAVLMVPLIAYHWVKPGHLSHAEIARALLVMGIAIALRWPVSLYRGGLLGLQKQVLLNKVLAAVATLQAVGAALVLWLISPTIHAFFIWQACISVLMVVSLAVCLWRQMPAGRTPSFRVSLLRDIWRFAAGMSGISLLSLALTQVDKVVLSKMLPLGMFGYYAFAATVAAGLVRLITPIATAYYPRFTQLVASGDQNGLIRAYHQGCQLMTVLVMPASLVIACFSQDILSIWMHNAAAAHQVAPILSLLIIGTALNGMMTLPYMLCLAYGWTALAFYSNVVAVVLLVPMVYVAALFYGGVGAAGAWIVLNLGYLAITIPFLHMRLLRNEKWRWYAHDIGVPILAATVMVWLGYLWVSGLKARIVVAGVIVIVYVGAAAASVLAASFPRAYLFRFLGLSGWNRVAS